MTDSGMIINGWKIYAHPLFLIELENLLSKVERLKVKYPNTYKEKNTSKRLAAVFKLISKDIPIDPSSSKYRQGNTLGKNNKHWFRAKFFQQFRLFFRYNLEEKIIIYAWINDENYKRAYNSKTDAYVVFENMLVNGNPPTDQNDLLNAVKNSTPSLNKTLPSNENA